MRGFLRSRRRLQNFTNHAGISLGIMQNLGGLGNLPVLIGVTPHVRPQRDRARGPIRLVSQAENHG